MKKNFLILILLVFVVLIVSFGFYSYNNFKIHQGLQSIPLSFDPYTSNSSFDWQGATVTIHDGFVKGLFKEESPNGQSLLLRALSPAPEILVKSSTQPKTLLLRLENINPANILIGKDSSIQSQIVNAHTILLTLSLKTNEEKNITFSFKNASPEFVILGDNRNGYQTFVNIIGQINSFQPAFVIDNGDLVFGGEPNRYRLFYETVSKLQVPLYTTLGNHDIRKNGRSIYTQLFGPAFYSYDYAGNHFSFLDSSRGWTEKRAIPEEEYQWLEKDLQKAQAEGKRIFVFTHIPPTDPRADLQPNTFPDIPGKQKTGILTEEFNKLSGTNNLDHAFNDKEEAKRFEALMTKYQVDTVFLSHIHSYFSFIKDNVRYIISGGAGAELLTKDSYYHYVRVQTDPKENFLEVVQLPSPPNKLQDRYLAAIQLFISSTYKEYTPIFIAIGVCLVLILAYVLWTYRQKWGQFFKCLGSWLIAVFKFGKEKYREIFGKDRIN